MKIKSPIYIENYGKTFKNPKDFLAFNNLYKDQSDLLSIDNDKLLFLGLTYDLIDSKRSTFKKLYYFSRPGIDDVEMRHLLSEYTLTNDPLIDYNYLQHCLMTVQNTISPEYTETYSPKVNDDYGAFWSGFAGGYLLNGGNKNDF